jgi:uncharacterized protein
MPIVDIHVHTAYTNPTPDSFAQYIVDHAGRSLDEFVAEFGNAGRYLKLMDENGIDYSCILAEIAPITSGVATNEYVAEFCAASPRLLPVCSVNPFIHHRPARLLERLVREEGFRGLKLYPTYAQFYPNDPKLYPVYAKAEELGIPVQVHTGSSVFRGSRLKYGDPIYLDDVAVDFPDLALLVTHGGRPIWYDHAMALVRFHPNVYIDVAGLPPQRLMTYFPDLPRLAHKFVFGSDWPGIPGKLADNVTAIRRLPIPEDAKEAILGGTAARLYQIPEL